MAREMPTTVYTEVQIDEDSISLTLISESGSNGPVVEDTARWTFDELQSELGGEHRTLRLSRESANALESSAVSDLLEEIEESMGREIDEGDVLIDDNPAPWSDDTRVVVEQVTDFRADEWQIERNSTVATANPSYPEDDTVVKGHYVGSRKTYAFPESRLVEPDEPNLSQKEWHDQYGN